MLSVCVVGQLRFVNYRGRCVRFYQEIVAILHCNGSIEIGEKDILWILKWRVQRRKVRSSHLGRMEGSHNLCGQEEIVDDSIVLLYAV